MIDIQIVYTPSFLRELRKLETDIQTEVIERTDLFKVRNNHKQLRVHKLTGKLKGRCSFSVTYAHRVVFFWENKQTAVFLSVGDHDIYK